MKALSLAILGLALLSSCATQKLPEYNHKSLKIQALTPKILVHVIYLNTNQWG